MGAHPTIGNEQEMLSELTTLRRMFHRCPEIGFNEFQTTAAICQYLSQIDCTLICGDRLYENFPEPELLKVWEESRSTAAPSSEKNRAWIEILNGRTGAVAVINGKAAGPKFGFRFDIDALPLTESTDNAHRPFAEGFYATNGNMHACGHDGHIAIGLMLAKTLAQASEYLKGEYYIFFQPAEETIRGGKIFSKLQCVKTLDYFFATHLGLIPNRNIICGVSFLADKRYDIAFKGRCAHAGASPEAGQNALLAACSAVTQLYSLSRHSQGASRINIGNFISDNAANIISDSARFVLDLRGETNDICDYLSRRAEDVVRGAGLMQNVESFMAFITDAETAENSPELISEVKKACLEIGVENDEIVDHFLVAGSEDATFIMNEVLRNGGKATYIGLCSQTYGGHHNENFDFDEEIMPRAVRLLLQLANNLSK